MPLILTWQDIAFRLALAFVAGALIGFDRSERGQAAGLRTAILVSVAAAAAMIQANLLLPTGGKAADSFSVMDILRMPLGILSGIGFIGAGVILRHGDRVRGITTAATMWFVTVMGLAIGGGQTGLGIALAVIGLAVLSGLKWIEQRVHLSDRQFSLTLVSAEGGPGIEELRRRCQAVQVRIGAWSVERDLRTGHETIHCELHGRALPLDLRLPDVVTELAAMPGVIRLRWRG